MTKLPVKEFCDEELCVCVKELYVEGLCVTKLRVQERFVKELCDKVACERVL